MLFQNKKLFDLDRCTGEFHQTFRDSIPIPHNLFQRMKAEGKKKKHSVRQALPNASAIEI